VSGEAKASGRRSLVAVGVGLVVILVVGRAAEPSLPFPLPWGRLGDLRGTVRLAGGADVQPTAVGNTTDPDVCGRTQSLEDLIVDPRSRGVANAVATLVGVPDSLLVTASGRRSLLIDNRDCRFIPHVSVAALGDTLVALNSDPVFHTTHYYGPLESNFALTEPGRSVATVVGQTGVITILCDLHGWMRGYIRVDEHRFHDVSDERGRFVVRRMPPGSYTVEIWHERLGTRRVPVEIRAGRTTRIDVELTLEDAGRS